MSYHIIKDQDTQLTSKILKELILTEEDMDIITICLKKYLGNYMHSLIKSSVEDTLSKLEKLK
jgi:hypothetical protein